MRKGEKLFSFVHQSNYQCIKNSSIDRIMSAAKVTIASILKSDINLTSQKVKSSVQQKAVNDIIHCRTEYFGGHILECQQ